MKLWEYDEAIENCFDEETGEIFNSEMLEALEMERDEKIENILLYIKTLKAEAEALKKEKQVLEARQKTSEAKAESLKQYIKKYLRGEKFSTSKVQVSYRKTTNVEIVNLSLVPQNFLRYKEPEPNKVDIKAALLKKQEVPGACLQITQSMQIK